MSNYWLSIPKAITPTPPAPAWPGIVRLISLGLLLLLPACTTSPQEQITQTMEHRETGLNRKDIGLYMSAFSANYNDGKKTYADIKAEALDNFQIFERLEYQTLTRSIYPKGEQAEVVQRYVLTFQTPGGKKSARGEEAFLLRNESGGWKIISKLNTVPKNK